MSLTKIRLKSPVCSSVVFSEMINKAICYVQRLAESCRLYYVTNSFCTRFINKWQNFDVKAIFSKRFTLKHIITQTFFIKNKVAGRRTIKKEPLLQERK